MNESSLQWRVVQGGLIVKLVALPIGLAAVVAAGLAWMLDDLDQLKWSVMVATATLALDALGRVLCFFGSSRSTGRNRVLASIVFQAGATLALLSLASVELAANATVAAILLSAMLLQFLAAWLFVVYLSDLAKALDHPDLLVVASISLMTLATAAGTVLVGALILAVAIGLLWLLSSNLLFWLIGCLIFCLALILVIAVVAVVLGVMYLAYAIALLRISWAIHVRLRDSATDQK